MGRKSLVFWLRLHWIYRLLWSVWTFSQYQPFESTDTDVFLCICVAFPVYLVSASYFSLQGYFLLVFFFFFGYCFPFPSFHCCYVETLLTLACFGSCPQSHDAHLLNCCFVVNSWELSKYRLMSTPCPVFYFSMPPVSLYIDRDLFFLKFINFLYVMVHNLECCCSWLHKLYFFLLSAFVSGSLLLSLFIFEKNNFSFC